MFYFFYNKYALSTHTKKKKSILFALLIFNYQFNGKKITQDKFIFKLSSKKRGIINFIVYKADGFLKQKGFSIWKFPPSSFVRLP